MIKRGQLTIFIILGILLIILVGTVIVLNANRSPSYNLPRNEEVSEQAQPVQDFINSCLADVGEQGLQLIGDHGGYTTLNNVPNIQTDPFETTESDALMFDKEGAYGVPYWWYMKAKNECKGSCEFASKRPYLHKREGSPSIEGQLEQYIEANLMPCFKSFSSFKEQNIAVTTEEKPDVTVVVTADDVVLGLSQTFEAERGGQTNTLTEFATPLDVRLKDAYDLATNITVLEAENAFLGQHVRELITAFSRTESDALPPVSSIEFELGPGTSWVKYSVEQRIIQLLQSYVPLLQVFGTSNYRPLEAPDGLKNEATVINALNRNAVIPQLRPWPEFEARFTYLDTWKLYFDLNCKGQYCKPEGFLNTVFTYFGIQRYNFAYDVSYPALVELREPGALNGRGFSFRFALEGNLRNNEPVTSEWEALPPGPAQEGSLFCDEDQRTSGVVNVTVHNSLTLEPADASILYECGTESCALGETFNGKLTTRFPQCIGGRVSAIQFETVSDAQALNTNTEVEQRVDLALHPIVELNASGSKYRTQKNKLTQSWDFVPLPVQMNKYDQMLVTLRRKEGGLNSVANLCGSNLVINPYELASARLAAGNYSVSISALYHGNITFKPTRRCFSHKEIEFNAKKILDPRSAINPVDYGPIEVETVRECYFVPENPIYFGDVPPENITIGNATIEVGVDEPDLNTTDSCSSERPFPAGNIQFDWEVTPEMLRHAKKIHFKAMTMGAEIPGTFLLIEDFEQLSQNQMWADANPGLFLPAVTP